VHPDSSGPNPLDRDLRARQDPDYCQFGQDPEGKLPAGGWRRSAGNIRGFELSSWNFIGHDPKEFRHYGPMAQDFFAAFGHDGLGQIGSETTINSGDMAGILMIAVQALEKRTAELKQKEAQIAVLQSDVKDLKAKHAYFETVAARLEALELRQNLSIQITADVMP
jgi:hypothetical protein